MRPIPVDLAQQLVAFVKSPTKEKLELPFLVGTLTDPQQTILACAYARLQAFQSQVDSESVSATEWRVTFRGTDAEFAQFSTVLSRVTRVFQEVQATLLQGTESQQRLAA